MRGVSQIDAIDQTNFPRRREQLMEGHRIDLKRRRCPLVMTQVEIRCVRPATILVMGRPS